jgi:hypothetical protein
MLKRDKPQFVQTAERIYAASTYKARIVEAFVGTIVGTSGPYPGSERQDHWNLSIECNVHGRLYPVGDEIGFAKCIFPDAAEIGDYYLLMRDSTKYHAHLLGKRDDDE